MTDAGTNSETALDPAGESQLAESAKIGGVTELAVLSRVKRGLVPGERRSYEERLRQAIANLAQRHSQGIPVELDRVSTIHFGRMIVLRPEQLGTTVIGPVQRQVGRAQGTLTLDDYDEIDAHYAPYTAKPDDSPPTLLLTLVEFDGELKPYMREIAQFLGGEFDAIFENCEDFPGTGDFELFWAWIRTFQINTDLFYATYRNLSVVRIKQLELFKRRFDALVARVRSPSGETVGSMDELFDDFLRAEQQQAFGFPYAGGTYANTDKPGD